MLVQACDTPAEAAGAAEDYISQARSTYLTEKESGIVIDGHQYDVIRYACNSETSPYKEGCSAFITAGSSAVCIELTVSDQYARDPEELLTSFLSGCHYAAEQ